MKISIMQKLLVITMFFFLNGSDFLLATVQPQQPKKNMINKVLYHKSSTEALELGQIVFCFTQEPTIEKVPTKMVDQTIERAFFFPGTKINGAAHHMVQKLNAASQEAHHYQFAIKQVAHGVKFVITYDPAKISIEYDSFTNIDCLKGLVFRIYNKELLAALQKSSGALLKVASATIKPCIVIDCGHGGTDSGTISVSNLTEKQVALDVGLQVARLLRHEGFDVVLTRDKDVDVALDDRTTLANLKHADMFVSIHANNASRENVSGVETFCLNDGLFSTAFTDSDPQFLKTVHTLMHDRNNDSIQLAACLHNNTLASVKKKHPSVVNRKVKNVVSQVLCGVAMPAALIEVGFLSNEHEAALLSDSRYCHLVAQGIRNGVVEYVKQRAA